MKGPTCLPLCVDSRRIKNNSNCVLHRCQLAVKGACGAINGVKGIIVLAKSVVTYINHSAPVQHCLHQLQKDSGVRKPRKVKQEMPVRWDTEFDMLSSVLRLKQFLLELFTLPIYLGLTITIRQWGVIAAICKLLYPCKIFMKKGQTGGEMASKGIFLIQQLYRDGGALSMQGMHT